LIDFVGVLGVVGGAGRHRVVVVGGGGGRLYHDGLRGVAAAAL